MYNVTLDGHLIGTTKLEHGDPTMGAAHGTVILAGVISGYQFFRDYCVANKIHLYTNDAEDRLITTACIPNLKVHLPETVKFTDDACAYIEGMDSDAFYINIQGVININF